MKNWFAGIETIEQLKQRYRDLARAHHPDIGGRTEDMQEINSQYDQLSQKLPKTSQTGERYQPNEREAPETFRAAVMAVINLYGVTLEICGTWLWLTGNTCAHKDVIKSAGYKWSKNKSAWYWHEEGYRKSSKRTFSLDEIRYTFGSEKICATMREEISA